MTHLKLSGYCLAMGGILLFLGNAAFSPQLPVGGPASDAVGSTAFAWRLGTNALTVFLLMVGSSGLYRHQAVESGTFGALAFTLAFVGSAFMFAHEWGQLFYMHTLASINPEAFNLFDDSSPTLYLVEIGLAAGGFSLGWILFSIATLMAKVVPRTGPALVLSGFFAIPLLSAVLASPVWGGVLGSIVLGSGLLHIGVSLIKSG